MYLQKVYAVSITHFLVCDLPDSCVYARLGLRSCTTSGISPGNTGKSMPLHVVHNITLLHPSAPIRYLRLYILRPAVGWGVSVWEFDVYGRNVLP